MSTIWGSVTGEGDIGGTVDGVPAVVDVAVSSDEDYRIAAWSPDMKHQAKIVLDRVNALALRDHLSEALDQGTWAV